MEHNITRVLATDSMSDASCGLPTFEKGDGNQTPITPKELLNRTLKKSLRARLKIKRFEEDMDSPRSDN